MYHEQFVTLAGYNTWANRRLFEAAAVLSPEQFAEDRGVFFRSLRGTLNHILCADRIWTRRITGTGEAPDRLDATLFEAFEPLRDARVAEDARIEAYVCGLREADLAATLRYGPITQSGVIEARLGPTLLHVFNHQTHHRGQAHAVLTGFGLAGPSMDLVAFQREIGRG
ncbi:damage-inducible protein DinB [Aureimonas flava]|uniref:Damage-inducible protein DinB n=1 Tax=Aureimonas flava TaxID=2320271 RepID=A0A3A1WXU1_9HYPH|nr:DinB family protein [Aureimonas flava]RIY03539.1 damage-inducible protein DinB [Aureimonas flava]